MCPEPSSHDKEGGKKHEMREETTELVPAECVDLSPSTAVGHAHPCTEEQKDHSSDSPGSRLHEPSPSNRIQEFSPRRQRSPKKSSKQSSSFYDFYPYFLLYLFGSSSIQPNLNNIGPAKSIDMENSREFFDPMVGNFKVNPSSDFFTSKLR